MSEVVADGAGGRIGHMCAFDDEINHELWIYDTLIEKWCLKRCTGESGPADIPDGTSGACCILSGAHIYMFGGYNEDGNSDQLYRLNHKTLKWKRLTPPGKSPIACDKSVCWQYNHKIYIFGGYGCVPDIDEKSYQFVFDPKSHWHYKRGWNNQLVCYDIGLNQWEWPKVEGTAPIPRAAHSAAIVGHKVFIFGGRHRELRMNDMYFIDMKRMCWSEELTNNMKNESLIPIGRSWHSFTPLSESQIVLYGGFSQDNRPLSDCWLLDIKSQQWSHIALPFSKPRLWHSAIASPFGEIIVFGGATQNILNLINLRNIKDLYSGDIITLRFVPKSLLRLCLDTSVLNWHSLQKQWKYLPHNIIRLLDLRKQTLLTNSAGS
ncbi:unnamed protein product [Medioppia subpectinata]|uniref:Kelch repeat protein n=1 Tax=Medioppia subpectinata TaxID=1979941 RepID=A0A7R9Q6S7_9ACAR|nr:unnamed protein product [Medioppia subpectinata]CAG2114937.1 unnamed protein product [Medioppia subpectinata]